MITGDHVATAIAAQTGLIEPGRAPGAVLAGADLAALPAAELPDIVARTAVLARAVTCWFRPPSLSSRSGSPAELPVRQA